MSLNFPEMDEYRPTQKSKHQYHLSNVHQETITLHHIEIKNVFLRKKTIKHIIIW